jgi:hypothetical protein
MVLQATAVLLIALALEGYLRAHETYVVSRAGKGLGRLVLVADDLVAKTHRGRRLIPNAHVLIRHHRTSGLDNIPMDINALGFRGPEIPTQKAARELRVLVLGDSITWADYLPEEKGYVRQAETALQTRVPDRRFTVVNGGIGDVGTTEELDLLEERGLAVAPDLVVLAWYLNDSRPPWGFAEEMGSRGWLRRHSLLAEKSYVYFELQRWIHETGEDRLRWGWAAQTLPWATRHEAFLELAVAARFDWGAAWDPVSWDTLQPQFVRLKQLANKHHFKVAVVAFPVSYQVYASLLDATPQDELRRRLAAFSFPVLDLLPLLRSQPHANWHGRPFGDDDLFFDQCHTRPEANVLIGREIASFVSATLVGEE